MGAIEKTLHALDERVGGACQVVAICGRNKTLIERLSNRCGLALGTIAGFKLAQIRHAQVLLLHVSEVYWTHRSFRGGLKVKVCGFVTNMAEWMTACDTIITKAGPGTIAEALICGLPIILNGFIPCQVIPYMWPVLSTTMQDMEGVVCSHLHSTKPTPRYSEDISEISPCRRKAMSHLLWTME